MKRINYKALYTDILNDLYLSKISFCQEIPDKKVLTVMDILELNQFIFGDEFKKNDEINQKFKSYSSRNTVVK